MRKQFVFLLFLFIGFNCIAQIGAVIGNDGNYKKSVPQKSKSTFNTKALSLKITKSARTDNQKATAIFKWITSNISYDNELRRNLKLQNEIYTSEENVIKKVLERKMALCGGFAFLFKKMCGDVGISAEVIHGFTKNYSGKIQKNKKPDHTWNAVKLNGEWQLLDITWAISHGTNRQPDSFWYLIKPSEFILSHYPENAKWTLLKNPKPFSEFQKVAAR